MSFIVRLGTKKAQPSFLCVYIIYGEGFCFVVVAQARVEDLDHVVW